MPLQVVFQRLDVGMITPQKHPTSCIEEAPALSLPTLPSPDDFSPLWRRRDIGITTVGELLEVLLLRTSPCSVLLPISFDGAKQRRDGLHMPTRRVRVRLRERERERVRAGGSNAEEREEERHL